MEAKHQPFKTLEKKTYSTSFTHTERSGGSNIDGFIPAFQFAELLFKHISVYTDDGVVKNVKFLTVISVCVAKRAIMVRSRQEEERKEMKKARATKKGNIKSKRQQECHNGDTLICFHLFATFFVPRAGGRARLHFVFVAIFGIWTIFISHYKVSV